MASGQIRIRLERSGGFAGMTKRASVDTATLPPEQAREITDLLGKVDLASVSGGSPAASLRPPPRGADRFQYDVTISEGGREHHLSVSDADMPGDLKPLIASVMKHSTEK